jgi:hypothetical protein
MKADHARNVEDLGMSRTCHDLVALSEAIHALDKSTSRKMLEANLRFLWSRYLTHPSPELPEHLKLQVVETLK